MTALETIFFDLDNTLCEYRRSIDEVLDDAFATTGVDPFFDTQDWFTVMGEGVGNSADSQREFVEFTLEAVAERHDRDPAVGTDLAAAYSNSRDYSNVRFLPGAEETLDALHGEYQLGIITNGGTQVQRQKLDALGIRDRFETVICPGNGVLPKPETDPFEHALADLDATPESSIHIGDTLEADIAGANAAGLHSAWVPYEGEPNESGHEPTHTLSSLDDLHSVLR